MNNNYKIKEILANKELFDWINKAKAIGLDKFLFKNKQNLGALAHFVAEQLQLEKKAKIKLPTWQISNCFYTTTAFEQCTAEAVAIEKTKLIKGNHLLVLAGGLGVDDWAFSKNFTTVISIDNNTELNELVRYNFDKLDVKNIERISQTAEEFLTHNTQKFDAIYIDPDRRKDDKRQILLTEHQPNVVALLPHLFIHSNSIWVKCSPLYDMDMAVKELPFIQSIHSISLYGEVKEMLLKIEQNHTEETQIITIDIQKKDTLIEIFNFDKKSIPTITETLEGYLYEVGASIVKVRKHHEYAALKNLKLIDIQVPFYIGDISQPIIGKCFKIITVINYHFQEIIAYCKSHQITQINTKARGLKHFNTIEFYKKTGLIEGGNYFAWIMPFKGKNKVVICDMTY